MRTGGWIALCAIACGSENKVGDDLDPPRHTQTSETTPTGNETTPDPDTATATDTPTEETGTATDAATDGTTTAIDPPTTPTDIPEEDICEKAAALTITLDPFQTPSDGRVYYCHSGSGNSYNYIETDISSCLPHLNHDYDIFPTTGCDS